MERIGAPARRPGRTVRCGVSRLAPAPPRRSWWPVVWAAAMAAGIAAIVVGLSRLGHVREAPRSAGARDAAPCARSWSASRRLWPWFAIPATQVVALAGLAPAPSARARMIWNAPKGGLLVTAGLPPAPSGKAYQLWAIAGHERPRVGRASSRSARTGRPASVCLPCAASTRWTSSPSRSSRRAAFPRRPARCTWRGRLST